MHTSQVAHQADAYPTFCNMKQLGVFVLPLPPSLLDVMLFHARVTPSIKFAGYPLIHLGEESCCESDKVSGGRVVSGTQNRKNWALIQKKTPVELRRLERIFHQCSPFHACSTTHYRRKSLGFLENSTGKRKRICWMSLCCWGIDSFLKC